MGNSSQTTGAQLQFIQQLEDRHFGEVDIYRSEEGRFIMKLKRTHISGDRRQIEFQRIVEWALREGDAMVVPIVQLDNYQQKGICIQYEVTHIFTEYYNYTLQDLLNSRKQVEQGQLWCVLEGLLHLSTTLRGQKLAVSLDLDNVFLTLKGTPCVYPYHIVSFEQSINCNQYGMGQLIAHILLQLATGEAMERTPREQDGRQLLAPLSRVCGRYRLLGRFIKELWNRQRPEEEVLKQIIVLAAAGKLKKMNGVKLNRFKYIIPDSCLTLQSQLQNLKNKEKKEEEMGVKKSNDIFSVESLKQKLPKVQSIPPADAKLQTNEKLRTQKSSVLSELSGNKGSEMGFSKQQVSKMLTDLQRKKEENRLQMQRFMLKKNQLLSSHLDKQNSETLTDGHNHSKQLLKRGSKEEKAKRTLDISQNSRRR